MKVDKNLKLQMRTVLRGGISKILTGSLVGQGMLLAVSPLLTRLYTPTDFAALTVFTAFATVMGAFITLSWERAIVIPRSDLQARAVVTLGLLTIWAMGLILTVASYFSGPTLDRVFGTNIFSSLWWLLPATVILMGLYSLLSSWLIRQKSYGKIAARNAFQGVSQAISSVVLGVIGAGTFGLLSGISIGRAVSILGTTSWSSLRSHPKITKKRLIATAKRFRRFPLISTWSRVSNILGLQLSPLLIVALYGTWEAGLYALTIRVLATPVGIVADAVSQYFEGVFSDRVREKSDQLTSLILTVSRRLFLISIVPGIMIVAFGSSIFGFIFGSEWSTSGVFAQIVIFFYITQFIVSPISRTLLILEKQTLQLVWDIARMIITLLAVLIPAWSGHSLTFALVTLAVSQGGLYAMLWFLCVRAAREREKSSEEKF